MGVPVETLRMSRDALVRQREVLDHHIALLDAELSQAGNGSLAPDHAPPHTRVNSPSSRRTTRTRSGGSSPPRGRDAVATVLRAAGAGVLVSDDDLLDGMVERGIGPNTDGDRSAQINAVRASANRLVKQQPDRFERIRGERSGYRFVGEPSSLLDDSVEGRTEGGRQPQSNDSHSE